MRNKKGSHVGMILSFLVFITFLGFLYTAIEPATKSAEDKLDLVAYLKVELLKEFSADMSTLVLKAVPASNCIEFDLPDQGLKDWGIVARDSVDNPIDSFAGPAKSVFEFDEGGIFKAYYSSEFDLGEDDIGLCDPLELGTTYNISLFKTTDEIFESKILNVSDSLEDDSNYEALKNKLNIGVGDEFGFVFRNESKGIVTGTEEKDVSTDVFVEEIPIQYLDSEANIKSGFLSIKVW